MPGTANITNVFCDLLERLFNIIRSAQLDTSLEHIGSDIRRDIRHCRRIRLGRHFITIKAIPNIFLIGIQRKEEHVEPEVHHVKVHVSM